MVGIRIDVNEVIATGHCIRCIAIASELKSADNEPLFITADDKGKAFVEQMGFKAQSLGTKWNDLNEEIESLSFLIDKQGIDRVLVDTYQVTPRYLEALSKQTKVMYMDDLNMFRYPVQAVCNYNIYAERLDYYEKYREKKVKLILGCTYAPLRNQFANACLDEERYKKPPVILITTGGGDSTGVAESLLTAISQADKLKGVKIKVLHGSYAKNIVIPNSIIDSTEICCNVSDVARLMSECSVAITASGMTMYELCACGLISASFTLADNQRMGALEFDRLGLIPYCGDVRNNRTECIDKIISKTIDNLELISRGKTNSYILHSLVDGNGAKRIAHELLSL